MKILSLVVLTVFFFMIGNAASAMSVIITGKIVGVHDGDTVSVLDDNKNLTKIRLADIDAPESKQPFGTRAKQFLSDMAYNKMVVVNVVDHDRYARSIGYIKIGDVDVNREIIRNGMGWVYRQYMRDASYLDDESYARTQKLGLWSLQSTEQVPPWEWRKKQHGKSYGFFSNGKEAKLFLAACCKVCRKGKPCGDSCIAQWKDCHVGAGCAC